MAFKRRGKKLETVKHGPFSVDIKILPDTGTFECTYGAESYHSAVLKDVRKWASDQLRTCSSLRWKPIMEVNFGDSDARVNGLRNCADISCWLERYYIAWTGKEWVFTPWAVERRGTICYGGPAPSESEQCALTEHELADSRIANSRKFYGADGKGELLVFPIKSGSSLGRRTYWVPYTEERWNTMLGIMDKFRELRTRIHDLLCYDGGWNLLASIAQVKLLGDAPSEPVEKD